MGLTEHHFVKYPVKEGCRVSTLIIPTLLRTNSRASQIFKLAAEFVQREITKRQPIQISKNGSGKNIFVSRGMTERNRGLKNRTEIEAVAKNFGFEIYYPEQHSLLAQLQTFADAHSCVGDYGSSLHGTVFCRSGAPVTALRWTQVDPGFLQSGIGNALSLPTGYIFGSAAIDETGYEICLNDLKEGLRATLELAR